MGKTLEQIAMRKKFNINVIGIKQIIPDMSSPESIPDTDSGMTLNPGGNFLIKESDILIVLGTIDDVEKLELDNTDNVAYITQTTLSLDDTSEIISALKEKFPSIYARRVIDVRSRSVFGNSGPRLAMALDNDDFCAAPP